MHREVVGGMHMAESEDPHASGIECIDTHDLIKCAQLQVWEVIAVRILPSYTQTPL